MAISRSSQSSGPKTLPASVNTCPIMPILLAILALLMGVECRAAYQPRWDVAYTARFYYPPGGKRISHRQVYLSDLHGRHRKQVTFGKGEPSSVRWVGRNHLAWLKSDGGRTVIEMLDLRSWNVHTFTGFKQAALWERSGAGSFTVSPEGAVELPGADLCT